MTRFIVSLWVLICLPTLFFSVPILADTLTPEERTWLSENPRILFAPAPNYPPVEFFDEQNIYRGITADFVAHIRESLGIDFEVIQLRDWSQVIESTKAGEVHMWGAAAETEERLEYMNFTRPYIRLPAVIIVRKEVKGVLSMEQLEGMKVVVIESYATQKYIQENYPQLQLIGVPDIETGLRMVSFGIADTIVATNASAIYYIEKNGLTNLRVAGESGYEWNLRFAARKEWPELISILQKGLDSISEDRKREIYRRWISLEAPAWSPSRQLVITVSVVTALLLIFGVLLWNRMLQRQVNTKTKELEEELVARGVLERELLRLATTDELTGVMNRRRLLEVAEKELIRSQRYKSAISMALFDVDHFKHINDSFGHAFGDQVLKELTEVCLRELRTNDLLGRIGGEEFVIMLVETDEDTAQKVLERLRAAIDDWQFELPQGKSIHVTVSVGFSALSEVSVTIHELLSQCDHAMYEAKRRGRNMVINHRDLPE